MINRPLIAIEDAIAAHGKWDAANCRCDDSVGYQCEYCAVHQGLQAAHVMALTDDKLTIANLSFKNGVMENALERIATPKRPDGTYNLCREACEKLAREALHEARTNQAC